MFVAVELGTGIDDGDEDSETGHRRVGGGSNSTRSKRGLGSHFVLPGGDCCQCRLGAPSSSGSPDAPDGARLRPLAVSAGPGGSFVEAMLVHANSRDVGLAFTAADDDGNDDDDNDDLSQTLTSFADLNTTLAPVDEADGIRCTAVARFLAGGIDNGTVTETTGCNNVKALCDTTEECCGFSARPLTATIDACEEPLSARALIRDWRLCETALRTGAPPQRNRDDALLQQALCTLDKASVFRVSHGESHPPFD